MRLLKFESGIARCGRFSQKAAVPLALAIVIIACVAWRSWAVPPTPSAAPTTRADAASATAKSKLSAALARPVAAALSGAASPKATATPIDPRTATLDLLSRTIDWYRQVALEDRLAVQPAETIFVNDDHQKALEVVKLAFRHARAIAELLETGKAAQVPLTAVPESAGTGAPSGSSAPAGAVPGLEILKAKSKQAEGNLHRIQAEADKLKAEIAGARGLRRSELTRKLAIVRGQVELTRSRLDSLKTMVEFESAAADGAGKGSGLSGQIDELERGVPQLMAEQAKAQAHQPVRLTPSAMPVPSQGLLGTFEAILRLGREQGAIDDRATSTQTLASEIQAARVPLVKRLRAINRRANELAAQSGNGDLSANRQSEHEFEELIQQHKRIVGALMPLAKQGVILQLYVANLRRWKAMVAQRAENQFRRLIVRLSALGLLLVAIFATAMVWRRLTFRYVEDMRRRRQLLQLRKFAIIAVVGVLLLFYFASELGALATVMGLAAAGIAFALQNVILSFAGYFFVTGRYGIRVGDRIQLAGVIGDVIDIGIFKLALMEFTGEGTANQPTGRVVVFPNSIVFQSNGNLFKQAPGTNFVWNEFRLTLAPECDYRLAEKRLVEVVEDVYARFRDTMQRQYRELERDLNVKLESPRPRSRIRLGQSGIEMTIRYPVDVRHAVQVADEISRRVLDTIAQEPGLTLVVPGTPNLQAAASSIPQSEQPLAADGAGADSVAAAPEVLQPPSGPAAAPRPPGTPAKI